MFLQYLKDVSSGFWPLNIVMMVQKTFMKSVSEHVSISRCCRSFEVFKQLVSIFFSLHFSSYDWFMSFHTASPCFHSSPLFSSSQLQKNLHNIPSMPWYTHLLKLSVRMSKGPNCKQRSSSGCLLCIGFFFIPRIYQRLYPSGERGERDGLWSVHICRTKEEAFFDVSARCTAFMGLHYSPFAPCCFSPHIIASAE